MFRGLMQKDQRARFAAWAAHLTILPPLLIFNVSQCKPIYLDRAVMLAGVAFVSLVVWGLGFGKPPARMRWTGLVLLVASFGLGLAGYYIYRGFPGSASDTLAEASQRVLGLEAEADIASAVGDVAGVWFIGFRRERQEYADLGHSQHPGLGWLQAHFTREETVVFGELELHHFAGPPSRATVRQSSAATWEPAHARLGPGPA